MEKKLLFSITRKDFDVQTFCAGGPGGQHQNKTASAVRIVHLPLGTSRPTPEEVLGRGEVLLEQRRPDLPGPGATLRLDLRKAGRGPGWIVVVAIRAGQVPGEPGPVLPWLHPAI